MSKIGSNIRKIRSVKALSQSDFALLFKLTRASIGSYEEGRAEPKIDTAIEIAKYFSISLSDIFTKDLTVNQLTNFLSPEKLDFNQLIGNSKKQSSLDFINSKMLSNTQDLTDQFSSKKRFNKIDFPNPPKGADTFFEVTDLFILGIRDQNIQAIIAESAKKPLKGSLILAISTNEICYGELMAGQSKIKLSDSGEEKTLTGTLHFFHIKLIISPPKASTPSIEDKLREIENRVKLLEKNN